MQRLLQRFMVGTVVLTMLIPAFVPTASASDLVPLSSPELPGGSLKVLVPDGEEAREFPLKHTRVTANIAGHLTHVTVQQEFYNPYEDRIEAVYVFPLPDDAAVNSMEMHIGERIVKAIIKTRAEARETYERARDAGQRAGLLEQERANIFTQSVANIQPGESITIEITYVAALVPEDGVFSFIFPMVVGPRYIPGEALGQPEPDPMPLSILGQAGRMLKPSPPASEEIGESILPPTAPPKCDQDGTGWACDTDVVPDASRITPPVLPPGIRSGHDIDVSVTISGGAPIRDLGTVTHAVDVTYADGNRRATVTLQDFDRIPNKDLVLRYRLDQPGITPTFLPYRDADGSGYFLLLVQPPTQVTPEMVAPKEIIFIVDTSGSMSGEPLAKVKAAMRHAVEHLNPDDAFTILSFKNDTDWLSKTPLEATPKNISNGLRYINELEAGGGTEMMKATEAALDRGFWNRSDRMRIVSLMSDGYVGGDREIITQVAADLGDVRLFPFGVGSSVNRYLINGLAQAGKGFATFVTLRDGGEEAVQAFYDRIENPLLTDISIEWGGLPVTDVVPANVPDLFGGQLVAVVGKFNGTASGTVTVHGEFAGSRVKYDVPVQLPSATDDAHASLPTIWARWRVAEVESDYILADEEREPLITSLGLAYNIVTQYTSFVAVEEIAPENPGDPPRTVPVPVEMPEGVSYEGVFGSGNAYEQMMPLSSFGVTAGLSAPKSGINEFFARISGDTSTSGPDGSPTTPRTSMIVGVLIAALLVVCGIIMGIIALVRRLHRKRTPEPPTSPPVVPPSVPPTTP
ncbi:MAG: VIT domain-containing protein [Candidatus Uhrbacteria bacterium]